MYRMTSHNCDFCRNGGLLKKSFSVKNFTPQIDIKNRNYYHLIPPTITWQNR